MAAVLRHRGSRHAGGAERADRLQKAATASWFIHLSSPERNI
jgi:hypothetical protein